MCCEIRHIESAEDVLGRLGVVVGRPAHEREAREGDDCIDNDAIVLDEEGLDGRPRIQAHREGWDHLKALGLKGSDHAVVVGGVSCKQIGAEHENAHPRLGCGFESW